MERNTMPGLCDGSRSHDTGVNTESLQSFRVFCVDVSTLGAGRASIKRTNTLDSRALWQEGKSNYGINGSKQ